MQKQIYSTKKITPVLLKEIKDALENVSDFGSIEIYIQDSYVTQITIRKIKKTGNIIAKNGNGNGANHLVR